MATTSKLKQRKQLLSKNWLFVKELSLDDYEDGVILLYKDKQAGFKDCLYVYAYTCATNQKRYLPYIDANLCIKQVVTGISRYKTDSLSEQEFGFHIDRRFYTEPKITPTPTPNLVVNLNLSSFKDLPANTEFNLSNIRFQLAA